MIRWNCDVCGQPIRAHQGWITISYAAINQYEEGKAAWEKEHPGPVTSLAEYKTHPEVPNWHVWHRECDPDIDTDMDSGDYTIEIERIRTKGQLLSWTAHLLGKTWFPSTNWDHIIRRILTPKELHV